MSIPDKPNPLIDAYNHGAREDSPVRAIDEQTPRVAGGGRYQLHHRLGAGRLGDVYKGVDTKLDRQVAVKLIKPEIAAKAEVASRFAPTVRALGRVTHLGLLHIVDFGQDEEGLYTVTELIEGPSLAFLFEEMRTHSQWLALAEALDLVRLVAQAADALYSQTNQALRIMPEKIKFRGMAGYALPAEISPMQPVITDLCLDPLLRMNLLVQLLANSPTLPYFAPEEILGDGTDIRSTVYGLGVLAFELVTGRPLFAAQTIGEAVDMHLNRGLPSPQLLQPALPTALAALITKALARKPVERPPVPRAFLDELNSISITLAAEAIPPTAIGGAINLHALCEQGKVAYAAVGVLLPANVVSQPAPPPLAAQMPEKRRGIQLVAPDGTETFVHLSKAVITVGRAPDNDLVIDHPRVSRKHARIEATGGDYRIHDLKSGNGTYVDEQRVPPEGVLAWPAAAQVRIGDHVLLFHTEVEPLALQLVAALPPPPALIQIQNLGITIERSRLSVSGDGASAAFYLPQSAVVVDPGAQTTISVVLLNLQTTATTFAIAVKGPPLPWVTVNPTVYELQGNEQHVATIEITPPRVRQSRAGTYSLQLEVTDRQQPAQVAAAEVKLKVKPFTDFHVEWPSPQTQVGDPLPVRIENRGNTPQSFKVMWWEEGGQDLLFEPAEAKLDLLPGETKAVQTVAVLRTQRWLGATKAHKIKIQISAPGRTQPWDGVLLSRGRIRMG